jgi:predicted transposase/invertase (TIGR01784 family)
LIESDDITDNIIAILCNIKDIDKLFTKLQEKLLTLDNKKREDYLRKLFYLLRLRPDVHDIYKKKQEEELVMPFIIEKERDPLYKDGLQKGVEEGLEKVKEREIAIAKKMLKQDMSIEMISKLTGLLEKEVKKLKVAI